MKKYMLALALGLSGFAYSEADVIADSCAWCWFADPRAIHFETPDGRINCTYLGYIDIHGNVRAMQYDFNKERKQEVLVRSYFQPDDHNNPTFLPLPDGRIMVFYSRHTDEPCFHYRVTERPGDLTSLGEEKIIETRDNTTYPSPFILADDPDHIYLCWRGINWHPTIAKLSMPNANGDVAVVDGPYQIVQSTGARPYAKYASDGKGKIALAYTTGHPDNESPNYLYYNYIDIKDMSLHDIEGKKLTDIRRHPFAVGKSDEYVQKHPATVVDASGYRDWLWQISADNALDPTIAMTRISDDKNSHNYLVAKRKDGKWKVTNLAHGGGHFHQSKNLEKCYSGGMCLDPENPSIVYCSVPVEGANGRMYEIVKYRLDGNCEVISTEAVTKNSTSNNYRPYAIAGTAESPLKLGWMNGEYYDWIVSKDRPKGYCGNIVTDFDGFESVPYGSHPQAKAAGEMPDKFNPKEDFYFTYNVGVDTANFGGTVLNLGDLTYGIDARTLKPYVTYKKKKYQSQNMLATSDEWARSPRGTNGDWYAPVKMGKFDLTMEYDNGLLTTYINGLADQSIRLAAPKAKPVFEVRNPDYKRSPLTGMTRKHWIEAGEYLLKGAFDHISSLDDPMYFQRQLSKTYPRNNGGIGVAKLEGLARTFFLAAPLLHDNPDLTLNGIKVADYYKHQISNLVREGSTSYVPHLNGGGPSQTLLELGSICMSLKVAQPIVWDTFSKELRDSIASLMLSYGEGPTIGSNWRFFNVFILSFLKDQGYKVNDEYLQFNLTELLNRYRGEGWYNDAPAYDYYSMWAFQTYGPLWAELFGKAQYPDLAAQFIKNQGDMVDNYPYMFSGEGKMNMWGRSLPYRFAAVSPLPFIEYGNHEGVNYGWLRRIASSTLLQFMQNPDFLGEDGIPTMGYFGVFAPAVQIYSCRGSVYWLGKAFFGLMLPEDSQYWSAVENNGPWEKDMAKGKVYNKFQPATNLMITNYPDVQGSEMRSWCKEKVANDWQKFRSSENYNKLAYHTEFPWMADGKNGEVSMNYATLNRNGQWEVLRLYDFKDWQNGQYRRDAVLETDENVKYQLTDIPLPGGVLRVDKVSVPAPTPIRLGSYSLPILDKGLKSQDMADAYGHSASAISNGEYSLAVVPVSGWTATETLKPYGLHPAADQCGVIVATDEPQSSQIYVTLHLWKKGNKPFTRAELSQVKKVDIAQDNMTATVTMADGTVHTVNFD